MLKNTFIHSILINLGISIGFISSTIASDTNFLGSSDYSKLSRCENMGLNESHIPKYCIYNRSMGLGEVHFFGNSANENILRNCISKGSPVLLSSENGKSAGSLKPCTGGAPAKNSRYSRNTETDTDANAAEDENPDPQEDPQARPARTADEAIENLEPLDKSSAYTKTIIKAKVKECKEAHVRARDCCEGRNSLACLPGEQMGGDGITGSSLAMGTAMGASLLQAFGGSGSITQNCDLMMTMGVSLAALNTASSAGCYLHKKKCDDSCEEFKDELDEYNTLCDDKAEAAGDVITSNHKESIQRNSRGYHRTLDAGQTRAIKKRLCPDLSDITTSLAELRRRANRCENFTSNAIAMAGQAGNAVMVTQMANLCKDAAQAPGPPIDPILPQNTDYEYSFSCANPANASLPRCQDCSLPGNSNAAFCKVAGSGETGVNRTSLQSADFGSGTDDSFNVGDDEDVDGAVSPFGNFDPSESRTSGVGGGGGGGAPGGGDGGGGGGGAPGGGGENPNKAYDTDIMTGTRSGSGFSAGGGGGGYRNASSGFKGYGRSSGKEEDGGKAEKPFNLKSYLPGAKNDPRNSRGLAGLTRVQRQSIGRPSENIWMKISNRFYELCKLNRLYDCNKIIRRKR